MRIELPPTTAAGRWPPPEPQDGLQFFVLDLMKVGIRKDEIIKMVVKLPVNC